MLIFSNPGILDPRVITTMGVNVKPVSDSPIGYFGTGLKYAIACSVRFNCTIEIFSDGKQYKFYPSPTNIRGKEFELVWMEVWAGGERESTVQLPFTLEFGKNWERWMVLRELWSNCMDEQGTVEQALDGMFTIEDGTAIVIYGMDEDWTNRGSWLLGSKPFVSTEQLEIHPGSSEYAFYKGMRVCKLPYPSIFTYNILEGLRLTEDRTADQYSIRNCIGWEILSEVRNKSVIRQAILALRGHFEEGIDFDWAHKRASDDFCTVVKESFRTSINTMNKSAVSAARKIAEIGLDVKSERLDNIQQKQLAKVRVFLEGIGFTIEHEIIIVQSLGDHWNFGLAKDNKIWLPKSVFGKGTKFLASTLLEEHLHLTEHLADESRAMQDRLFDLVISLGERVQGEPL